MSARQATGNASTKKPRWYAPSIAKYFAAILLLQAGLYLSSNYHWFWFNDHKGLTVLVAVAVTAPLLLLVSAWVVVGRFFGAKTQFSLAALLLIVPVAGIPCGWLAREIDLARRQRASLATMDLGRSATQIRKIQKLIRDIESEDRSPVLNWLRSKLGDEFFEEQLELDLVNATDDDLEQIVLFPELRALELKRSSVTNAGLKHLRQLKSLETLTFIDSQITDAGMEHLKELSQLKSLSLSGNKITDAGLAHLAGFSRLESLVLCEASISKLGIEALARDLPNCEIQEVDGFIDLR